jgi:hypothetical protein
MRLANGRVVDARALTSSRRFIVQPHADLAGDARTLQIVDR